MLNVRSLLRSAQLVFFVCCVTLVQAQSDSLSITSWLSANVQDYAGVYQFGEGAEACELVVFVDRGRVYLQHRSGAWETKQDGEEQWIPKYENFSKARITNGVISCSDYRARFVKTSQAFGLQAMAPPAALDTMELKEGWRRSSLESSINGKFPKASLEKLSTEELLKMAVEDIKLMKGEIFARYGYIFRSNKKMAEYFKAQQWYVPRFSNVINFLTPIEQANVKTLAQIERALGG